MGLLRFLLAMFVIASHAGYIGIPFPSGKPYPAWAMFGIEGRQAVGIFFIISGFYMTMVLNTKYISDTLSFYINRFLRLWPTYLFSIIIVALFTNNFKITATLITNSSILFKAYIWFSNFFILGSDFFWLLGIDHPTGVVRYFPAFINDNSNVYNYFLNVPVFSISVEIMFYLMAPFILKSIKRVWIFFAIGIAYYAYFVLAGQINIIYQYHIFPYSFLYFSLGALSWHYYYRGKEYKKLNYLIIILLIVLMQFAFTIIAPVILLTFTLLTPYLFEITKNNKVDRFIGELSYPIYILHYPVLQYFRGVELSLSSLGIVVFLITIALAVPVHLFIERPIDKFRQRRASLKTIDAKIEI